MRSTLALTRRALLLLGWSCLCGCGGGSGSSGFGSAKDSSDRPSGGFGSALASPGDLNGDGRTELAVGIPGFDGKSEDQGAVDILFLQGDGSSESRFRIASRENGFSGDLDRFDSFGKGLAFLGDLDGDSVNDLAVGAPGDDDGKLRAGALWILLLSAEGSVKAHQKISAINGGFSGELDSKDEFGSSVAVVGDLDGDGFSEVAVGAPGDDDGGDGRGVVWLLSLNPNGSVRQTRKISSLEGGFIGPIENKDHFGGSLAALGDLDQDGVPDLAVGAPLDGEGGYASGAVWILFLKADGTVKAQQKINSAQGGLSTDIHGRDQFGAALKAIGDLNGDGVPELAVGAPGTDGKLERGALWVVFLERDGAASSSVKVQNGDPGLVDELGPLDRFGSAVSDLGDLDLDGLSDVAVGTDQVRSRGRNSGDVWFLFLREDGTLRSSRLMHSASRR